jgi:hypothetical protein
MKIQFNKTKTSTIALVLMLTFAATFGALSTVNAQDLIMNLPGNDVDPYNVELHESIDIDLNGAHAGGNIELWVKYPGRADFTFINAYPTAPAGDLDVYDFDFNETGLFELKWMLGGVSSNVRCQPTFTLLVRQLQVLVKRCLLSIGLIKYRQISVNRRA